VETIDALARVVFAFSVTQKPLTPFAMKQQELAVVLFEVHLVESVTLVEAAAAKLNPQFPAVGKAVMVGSGPQSTLVTLWNNDSICVTKVELLMGVPVD